MLAKNVFLEVCYKTVCIRAWYLKFTPSQAAMKNQYVSTNVIKRAVATTVLHIATSIFYVGLINNNNKATMIHYHIALNDYTH